VVSEYVTGHSPVTPACRNHANRILVWANLILMASMRIVSVNVGRPQLVLWKGTPVSTGIFKDRVEGPVEVKTLNLAGDRQADLSVYGGPDKAVYAYPAEHYSYWRRELPDAELPWGAFGENLTTQGLSEETLHIGDRLRIGSAAFVVTQPRVPCYKLTICFDRDDMIKRFIASHTSGYYFSVEEQGELAAGSSIEIVDRDPNAVKVSDINRLYYGQPRDQELLQRVLNVGALPEGWREHLRQKLSA
jgi:MOSC domain-containing protein YiiM